MAYNYRNPIYTQSGAIDCEIEHSDYGWIPFTAQDGDTDPAGQELYDQIVADGNIDPAPAIDLDAVRARARYAIDYKAGEVRARFVSYGPAQDLVYAEKERQATAFKDAGYPEGNLADYTFIEAEATAISGTGQQAADLILAQRDVWLVAGAAIERERRLGKIVVDQQLGKTAIDTARDNAIATLDAITP